MERSAESAETRRQRAPEVGDRAPDFFIQTGDGRMSVGELAARQRNLILISRDSYRFHPG